MPVGNRRYSRLAAVAPERRYGAPRRRKVCATTQAGRDYEISGLGRPPIHLPIDAFTRFGELGAPMKKIQRALLSVSDKTGLVPFAQILAAAGVELISTGGTAKTLRRSRARGQGPERHTGFPEMLDGRVKTLHPKVHGGLLYHPRQREPRSGGASSTASHPIDLVVVNLYPFEQTVARPDVSLDEAIENIDIGGPAMLRSAAKNHESVTVVVDPADYAEVAGANPGPAATRRWNCAAGWRPRSLPARPPTTPPSRRIWPKPSRRKAERACRRRCCTACPAGARACATAKTRTKPPRSTDSFATISSNCTARNFPTTTFWT